MWTSKQKVPLNLPRCCSDFAFRKTDSKSKLTAWTDIGGVAKFCECRLRCAPFLERLIFILGIIEPISIPSNTCKAASMFPFWYSILPSNALASCKMHTFSSKKDEPSWNKNPQSWLVLVYWLRNETIVHQPRLVNY